MTAPTDDAHPPHWFDEAVIYEIYPQSFADSNGDGIGDLPGVLAHLDHLAWLGVTAIWFNPCFASPFRDAGYDVSDYLQVAPRYGTNEDLVRVVDAARERGIRVILDLVAGHTSVEHAWFRHSLQDPTDDRYVWSDAAQCPGEGFVASPGPRPGWYLRNFYDEQPALNFGYARTDPAEPWRHSVDDPGPRANVEALREVMDFWLSKGVAGFRVDMAFSLVKDDPGYLATTALWQGLRGWLDEAHPDAVIVPEGVEPVTNAAPAFHGDFFLVIHEPHSSLFNNGGAGTMPWMPPRPCWADPAGGGSAETLVRMWTEHQDERGGNRRVVLPSSDHDFSRLACGTRTRDQLAAAYALLLTWPSVPSIYYGDEIGMRYQNGLPDVEGSVYAPGFYNRAGARTPMQWDDSPGAGFSTAAPGRFYLPLDTSPDRPSVAAQRDDEGSLLHLVRRLVHLRRSTPALGTQASLAVLATGYPFAYVRGGTHLVVLNPSARPVRLDVAVSEGARPLESSGARVGADGVALDPYGFAVLVQ